MRDLFVRDEPRHGRVQFIEDVEHVAVIRESAPIAEVLVERQESQWQKVDGVDHGVKEDREEVSEEDIDAPREP